MEKPILDRVAGNNIVFTVWSHSHANSKTYNVVVAKDNHDVAVCNCPAFIFRVGLIDGHCKHIRQVIEAMDNGKYEDAHLSCRVGDGPWWRGWHAIAVMLELGLSQETIKNLEHSLPPSGSLRICKGTTDSDVPGKTMEERQAEINRLNEAMEGN